MLMMGTLPERLGVLERPEYPNEAASPEPVER